MQKAILVALSVALLYALQKYLEFRRAVASIRDHPGFRSVFTMANPLLKWRIPGITPGNFSAWMYKHQDFVDAGWDVVSVVHSWPKTTVTYMLADAGAIRDIANARARFPKPLEQYKILSFYGSNIVITEGDEWKRQRKISAPAFSERNNKLVWDETINVMSDLFNNVWGEKEQIEVDHIVDLTVPIALYIIGIAGFGRRMSWSDEEGPAPGHKLTFKDALHTVSTDLFLKVVCPGWLLKLGPTERIRHFHTAYDELERYMHGMVRARKQSEKKEERYDLFSSLLDANEDESDGKTKLSDEELVGNIFIFLIAGHETTAHTLAYTFIMLALYPDVQEKLYEHIKGVIGDGRLPSYEDMNSLTYSMAVFNETLRMFPPVNGIPKRSAEDTTIVASNGAGEKCTIVVPQGTNFMIHTPGLHYNPRYWEDPYAFKPERFLGDWPRDAFCPFSAGPRACLGRRFSETEGVAILSLLVLRYRIEVREEPHLEKESFDERKARLLNSSQSITLHPVKAPLVFKRR
ncbi:cytochrome P450 [Obba rivulosa]|uniref:Cytochrome P450 n=1 Tax=Obba rivulosa TaxID=1052685 RepID=A0A8E2DH83_9APHY|nr:cytochrome P450 [Obba rivulosa]